MNSILKLMTGLGMLFTVLAAAAVLYFFYERVFQSDANRPSAGKKKLSYLTGEFFGPSYAVDGIEFKISQKNRSAVLSAAVGNRETSVQLTSGDEPVCTQASHTLDVVQAPGGYDILVNLVTGACDGMSNNLILVKYRIGALNISSRWQGADFSYNSGTHEGLLSVYMPLLENSPGRGNWKEGFVIPAVIRSRGGFTLSGALDPESAKILSGVISAEMQNIRRTFPGDKAVAETLTKKQKELRSLL